MENSDWEGLSENFIGTRKKKRKLIQEESIMYLDTERFVCNQKIGRVKSVSRMDTFVK